MLSQITGSNYWPFMGRIWQSPVDYSHKRPVMHKWFSCNDAIMPNMILQMFYIPNDCSNGEWLCVHACIICTTSFSKCLGNVFGTTISLHIHTPTYAPLVFTCYIKPTLCDILCTLTSISHGPEIKTSSQYRKACMPRLHTACTDVVCCPCQT